MIEFFDDQLQLFGLLIRHNVKFVVIGGYAVINYGYERVTSDLDIWIKNNENRDLLVDALEGYKFTLKTLCYCGVLIFPVLCD